MARVINVIVTSESDGTTRDAVPDYLIHVDVNYLDAAGEPQSFHEDAYFLALLNWLRINYPHVAVRAMRDIAVRILRLQHGVDGPGTLP